VAAAGKVPSQPRERVFIDLRVGFGEYASALRRWWKWANNGWEAVDCGFADCCAGCGSGAA
jgi:hypothetical protein